MHALSDINLDIEEGKTRAIIGPNGAGKSTLLNVCVGRIRPDTGSVIFEGQAITGKTPYQINQLGVGASSRRRRFSRTCRCSRT